MRNRFLRQFFCVLSMLVVFPATNYAVVTLPPEQQAKERLVNNLTCIGMISMVAAGLKTFVPALKHGWHSYAYSHPAAARYTIPGIIFLTGLGLSCDYQCMLNDATLSNSKEFAPVINGTGLKYTALATLSAYMLQRLASHGINASLADLQQFSAEHPMARWCALGTGAAAFAAWYVMKSSNVIKPTPPQVWCIARGDMTIKAVDMQAAPNGVNVAFSNGIIKLYKFGSLEPEVVDVGKFGNFVLSPDNQLVAYTNATRLFLEKLGQSTLSLPMQGCSKIVFTNDGKNLVALYSQGLENKVSVYTFDMDDMAFKEKEPVTLSGKYKYCDLLIGPDNTVNICYKYHKRIKTITYRIMDDLLFKSQKNSYEFDVKNVIVPCFVNGKLNFAAVDATQIRWVSEGKHPSLDFSKVQLEGNSLVIKDNKVFGVDHEGMIVSYLFNQDPKISEKKIHGKIDYIGRVPVQKAALCDNKYVVTYTTDTEIKIAAFSIQR